MPQPPTLKIVEVFPSIQGEGLRQGEPAIFIRFAGCNLRCSFCDTRYAWTGGKELSAQEVLAEVEKIRRRFPGRWVCLTGGEPLLQDVRELIRLLKKRKLKIQVETNATRYLPLAVDWYTVSPKPRAFFFAPQYRTRAKEVKLVVTKELRLGIIRRLRAVFPEKIPILLQPQSNKRWSQKLGLDLLEQALAAGLVNIRLSLQLHKIIGIR